jgi:hypothetical protein
MPRSDSGDKQPRDVLAAEEFGVPAPDPKLHPGEPHDVLAAEEFALPAPDPTFGRRDLQLPVDPDDPDGSDPPHDVLAAEEFAVPGTESEEEQTQAEMAPASALREWSPRVAVGVAAALVIGGAVSKLRQRS